MDFGDFIKGTNKIIMSKIKKQQQIVSLPLSDWDNPVWTRDMYKKYENEFQVILGKYRKIRSTTKSAIDSRWKWIESEGGESLQKNEYGIFEPKIMESRYAMISNKFSRFTEWLSFKERTENTPEKLQTMRNEISREIKAFASRTDFGIPKEIIEGAERDIQFENEKDIVQSALNNF